MRVLNRGIAHSYRGKSQEAGEKPAGILSQNVGAQRNCGTAREPCPERCDPDMLCIITWRGEIVVLEGS